MNPIINFFRFLWACLQVLYISLLEGLVWIIDTSRMNTKKRVITVYAFCALWLWACVIWEFVLIAIAEWDCSIGVRDKLYLIRWPLTFMTAGCLFTCYVRRKGKKYF